MNEEVNQNKSENESVADTSDVEKNLVAESNSPAENSIESDNAESNSTTRRQIKIGSQRTPFERVKASPNIAKPSAPVTAAKTTEPETTKEAKEPVKETTTTDAASTDSTSTASTSEEPTPIDSSQSETQADVSKPSTKQQEQQEDSSQVKSISNMSSFSSDNLSDLESGLIEAPVIKDVELPNDLQSELDEALAGVSLDDLMDENDKTQAEATIENDTRLKGTVVSVHRDNVFINLRDQRNQAVASLRQFDEPPEVGAELNLIVKRFSAEDGLYEVAVPGASVRVGDWSEVAEGMIVETMITGYNKGGLECEVSRLRGFIPAGQVSLYHVDDLEQFVGQKMTCVVTEVNEEKRNLVLSHRALLEREKAAAKEKLLEELAVGQEREGVVSKLMDFGAFVDLGGLDGLIHISQMSWDRVKHPSEVLEEGQRVKVKVEKVDPVTGKISLAYRDLFESPWVNVPQKYPVKTTAKGTVSKIMDFGAFVRLEAGVEGLVHISEISHQRVFRVSDVLKPEQEVEVQIQSIDTDAQRISLSMKALEARVEPKKKEDQADDEAAADEQDSAADDLPPVQKFQGVLKGGIGGGKSDGDKFGLKW